MGGKHTSEFMEVDVKLFWEEIKCNCALKAGTFLYGEDWIYIPWKR